MPSLADAILRASSLPLALLAPLDGGAVLKELTPDQSVEVTI